MKKIILSLGMVVFSLGLLSNTGYAAEAQGDSNQAAAEPAANTVNYTDVIALQRSFLQLQQQKVVLSNLQLTQAESDKFWPIYRSYQNSYEPLGDRLVQLILSFNEKFESMSDAEATAMLKESQDILEAEQGLRREYIDKFSAVLSPKKVLRFFQIDNKMRAEIRYNISLEIPLLEVPEESTPI